MPQYDPHTHDNHRATDAAAAVAATLVRGDARQSSVSKCLSHVKARASHRMAHARHFSTYFNLLWSRKQK